MIGKNYKQFSDESLILAIKNRNVPAFNELYNRYSKRLFMFLLHMLNGNEEMAKDFLQDIFIIVIEKCHYFNSNKKFSGWIFTVAKNLCINEYKALKIKNKKVSGQSDYLNTAISLKYYQDIDEKIDKKKFKESLFSELNKLTHESKTIFLLRFQENFSIKEISAIVSLPEGTVKSRLFYMIKKLAVKLATLNPNR